MVLRMNAGPEDASVLKLQESHVSQHIWQGKPDRHLRVRRAHKFKHQDPHERMLPYLKQAGFVGLAHMGYCTIDHSLITALVERWRPETHTFHMPTGECTITLEDIAIISGLPIDGSAVTGCAHRNDWMDLCTELLGAKPGVSHLFGARVNLSWLWDEFTRDFVDDDDEIYVQRCTRAYMLRLIGGLLFPDHSGRFVHMMFLPLLEDFTVAGTYSWGSAVLAYLYRELCKATDYTLHEIGGACTLLQYWAWYRFPRIAPGLVEDTNSVLLSGYTEGRVDLRPMGFQWHKHKVVSETLTGALDYYRRFFDQLKNDEITWQPYTKDILEALPSFCVVGREIFLAVVPLIYFHIVEWHQPDRVMRQFGFDQPIPKSPLQPKHLHTITLAGRNTEDWSQTHLIYIEMWNTRRETCVTGRPLVASLTARSKYMQWYKRITRRWISRVGASIGFVADVAERQHAWATDPASGFSMTSLKESAEQILYSIQEHDRITMEQLWPAPLAANIPGPPERSDEQRTRRRRTRLASTWTRLYEQDESDSSSQSVVQPLTTTTTPFPPSQPPTTANTAHPPPQPPTVTISAHPPPQLPAVTITPHPPPQRPTTTTTPYPPSYPPPPYYLANFYYPPPIAYPPSQPPPAPYPPSHPPPPYYLAYHYYPPPAPYTPSQPPPAVYPPSHPPPPL